MSNNIAFGMRKWFGPISHAENDNKGLDDFDALWLKYQLPWQNNISRISYI